MPTLRIAILQPPAPDYGRAEAAWSDLLARIDDAAQDEPDLVVLPEASYPAWFLGAAATTAPVLSDARILGDLAERARQHGIHVAAGLVLGRPGAPQNAAVLLSADGVELARATESKPAPWFQPGRGPAAATIAGAPVALFAGADHLDPRWVEAIADARTELCIATGAARGWAGPRQDPPVAGDPSMHVIATRAIETGAWFAVAGRAGVEADSVGYAGGAGIASPHDGWLARAPEDRAGIVLHACELSPPVPGVSPLPTRSAPPAQRAEAGATRVAALALDPSPSVVELMESVRASVRAAAALGAQVIVLPDLTGPDPRAVTRAEVLPLLEEVAAETRTVVVAGAAERSNGELYRSVSVVEDGRLLATYRQAVLAAADLAAGFRAGFQAAGEATPVVATQRAGVLGLLAGREGLQPSAAAELRRSGAQLIAWCAGGDTRRSLTPVAQTRAWEQRLPVAAAGGAASGACVAGEGGVLLAVTRAGTPMLTHATVERRASS
ncbi:MAG: nitrilase-related carbon-nitrogen hydrolase [Dehalococcoidia bacterium]